MAFSINHTPDMPALAEVEAALDLATVFETPDDREPLARLIVGLLRGLAARHPRHSEISRRLRSAAADAALIGSGGRHDMDVRCAIARIRRTLELN